LAFWAQNKAKLFKKFDHNIGFSRKMPFPKIVKNHRKFLPDPLIENVNKQMETVVSQQYIHEGLIL
jgi:hypothetical protein